MYKVATVGSFDGVHLGHAALVEEVCRQAAVKGGIPVVVTFEPHPRLVLERDSNLRLLSTLEERRLLLERLGVQAVEVIHFDERFSRLSRERFVEEYIIGRYGINSLVVGYNHRFGHDNSGDYEFLSTIGSLEVLRVQQRRFGDEKISSTVVRDCILRGEVGHAARLLGHPYLVMGHADCNGLVNVDARKLLPPVGRYDALADGERCQVTIVGESTISLDSRTGGDKVIEICSDMKHI